MERRLLAALLLAEGGIALWLTVAGRVPVGHDALQLLMLQHGFMNHAVTAGGSPQWMPFLTHGTVSSWFHLTQASAVQQTACLAGIPVGFLTVYHLGMLFEHVLLVVGTWLLARRFTASPWAAAFTALSAGASAVGTQQPAFNLHLVAALPMTLHLVHRFVETSRWRYVALAGNLTVIHVLGGALYFVPIITFVVFLYLVCLALVLERETWWALAAGFRLPRMAAALAAVALPALLLWVTSTAGTERIRLYMPGRTPDGSVARSNFMAHGGNLGPVKWIEMGTGVSPCMDYTLYLGAAAPALVLAGLVFGMRRARVPPTVTAAVVLLFSMGTVVSLWAYRFWPLMDSYRHLALVSSIVRVLLCFLAGWGFETVFVSGRHGRLAAGAMAAGAAAAAYLAWDPSWARRPLEFSVKDGLSSVVSRLGDAELVGRLGTTAAAAAVMGTLALAAGRWPRAAALAVAVHAADLMFWRVHYLAFTTHQPPLASLDYSPIPWVAARADLPPADRGVPTHPRGAIVRDLTRRDGAIYATMDSFLYADQLDTTYRCDHWLQPLDAYMNAYRGLPFDKRCWPELNRSYGGLIFPRDHPAAARMAGAEGKLQVFSGAVVLPTEAEVAAAMTDPEYAGTVPILLGPAQDVPGRRVEVEPRVTRFDADHLELEVEGGGWLVYSDVWHPTWRAEVNGRPAPILRANLAYKAVKLEPGVNRVAFAFGAWWVALSRVLLALNAAAWLALMGARIVRLLRTP